VQLKARFDNTAQGLWPGQLVPVRMLLRTQHGAVVVPQEAVQQGSKGPFVYLADAQKHAQVRDVVTGPVVNGKQWIRSGLQAGETVVVQGQSRVAAGVTLTADTGVSAATPTAGGQP
jgi:membrane fusion protein, multidrug efflux system